eukprot:365285-Chlamydomonas_euryale.AAC.8
MLPTPAHTSQRCSHCAAAPLPAPASAGSAGQQVRDAPRRTRTPPAAPPPSAHCCVAGCTCTAASPGGAAAGGTARAYGKPDGCRPPDEARSCEAPTTRAEPPLAAAAAAAPASGAVPGRPLRIAVMSIVSASASAAAPSPA